MHIQVGFLHSVNSFMCLKETAVCLDFPTLLTYIVFLSTVNLLMFLKTSEISKATHHLLTFRRILSLACFKFLKGMAFSHFTYVYKASLYTADFHLFCIQ